jgi:hypothetical protein
MLFHLVICMLGNIKSGLRINGNDYGNTIYQDAITIGGQPADIGFTLRNANSFVFRSLQVHHILNFVE